MTLDHKRMTVYELAEACGVSIATVSRVLNGYKHVRAETRERVLKRMEELGFQPSAAARALSTGRTQVVSVWIGNLNSRYVMAFLGQLEQHLTLVDYEMTLRNLWHRPIDEPLGPVNADGVIVLDELGWVTKIGEANLAKRMPVVSMGAFWGTWVDHVGLDLTDGFKEAVEHLVSVGCRRIGYVSPKVRNNPEDPRYCAYLSKMAEMGLEPEIIESSRIAERAKVEEAMSNYLAHSPCPDGLLCHNDDHAIAVCRVLRRHGLKIPEDVAVVGCNGLIETEYLEHPLSTIVLPVADACETAWRLLENRMRDPSLPIQSVVYKPRLEVRASSSR